MESKKRAKEKGKKEGEGKRGKEDKEELFRRLRLRTLVEEGEEDAGDGDCKGYHFVLPTVMIFLLLLYL